MRARVRVLKYRGEAPLAKGEGPPNGGRRRLGGVRVKERSA